MWCDNDGASGGAKISFQGEPKLRVKKKKKIETIN